MVDEFKVATIEQTTTRTTTTNIDFAETFEELDQLERLALHERRPKITKSPSSIINIPKSASAGLLLQLQNCASLSNDSNRSSKPPISRNFANLFSENSIKLLLSSSSPSANTESDVCERQQPQPQQALKEEEQVKLQQNSSLAASEKSSNKCESFGRAHKPLSPSGGDLEKSNSDLSSLELLLPNKQIVSAANTGEAFESECELSTSCSESNCDDYEDCETPRGKLLFFESSSLSGSSSSDRIGSDVYKHILLSGRRDLKEQEEEKELVRRSADDATELARQKLQDQNLINKTEEEKEEETGGQAKATRSKTPVFTENEADAADYSTDSVTEIGFRLRALSRDISELEANLWAQAPTLPKNIQISSLNSELVNETLNYFVNCRQRLSQMTKTYDDNDAYIYLLQEKEVDLELAARIGQDLLKQNKSLKANIEQLERELTRRKDDVQQLRHELNSKTTLLDECIHEGQEQESLAQNVSFRLDANNKKLCELQDELMYKNEQIEGLQENIGRLQEQLKDAERRIMDSVEENESLQKFLRETIENQMDLLAARIGQDLLKQNKSLRENIEQLERQLSRRQDDVEQLKRELDNKTSLLETFIHEEREQEMLAQDVSFRLIENNKKLSELQDELLYKSEQNILQQRNIKRLQQQLKESERQLDSEKERPIRKHESLRRALRQSLSSRSPSESSASESASESSDNYLEEFSPRRESSLSTASLISTSDNNNNTSSPSNDNTTTTTTTSNESPTPRAKRTWLGFSSFLLTSILLLYLSVTLSPSPSSTLPAGFVAPKLQLIKLDK